MGLDEDGNLLPEPDPVSSNCPSDTLHISTSDAINKETKPTLSLEAKKRANIERTLQELSSPGKPALIQSPYRAKSTEKYPIKVKNQLTTGTTTATTAATTALSDQQSPSKKQDQVHPVSPFKTEYNVPKKSNSPHRAGRSKHNGLTAKDIYSGTVPHSQDSDLYHPVLSPAKNKLLPVSSVDISSNSIHNTTASGSVPLSAYGSPVVLGAVRSSFLTDLGLSSLEPPVQAVQPAESVYAPPMDVPVHVLVSSASVYCIVLYSIVYYVIYI